jgi:hypothetical protein
MNGKKKQNYTTLASGYFKWLTESLGFMKELMVSGWLFDF